MIPSLNLASHFQSVPRRLKIVLFGSLAAGLVLATVSLFVRGRGIHFADYPPDLKPDPKLVCNSKENCAIKHALNTSSSSTGPSVLYYNTHGGTNENMKGIMQSLNLNLDIFNPKLITNYGMTAKRAKKLIQAGHVEWICSQYDVIIIGDTVPHGRALLQSMVERSPARRCRSKLVVEMTNRFDWDIKDRNAYYGLVRRLIKERSQDVFWVANNNLEKPYVEFFTQTKMKDVRLLRPIGISGDFPYPSDLPPPSNETFASRTHDTTNIFHILRDIHKIPLTIFPFGHKYGGPQNLLAFKGFIDVPYQYSVMKFYENIAYGVPQFIPTPRLFESLLAANLHFTHCIYPRLVKEFPAPGTKDADEAVMLVPGFPAWSAYMDYYDPLFAPYVYYFDNVQELQSVAEKRTGAEVDWKKVRERGPLFYGEYRGRILEGWALLFRDMGFDGVKVVGFSN